MAIYNLTNFTYTTATGTADMSGFVCHVNVISEWWWALILLFTILIISIIAIQRYGYTLYTSLSVSFVFVAFISTLFRLWTCQGQGMISTYIVIVMWVLAGLFTAIRIIVKD